MNGFNKEYKETDEIMEEFSDDREMNSSDDIEEDDLLLQQSDREENVFEFLQALDLQVIGACRADERLIPFLKKNVSNCPAEDRILSHLAQHFEAQEIGMLARCLCMPLVSIRVGKIVEQGNLLSPTSLRGSLNLTLLPSSNLRISFTGDDGCLERVATLSSNCKNPAIKIEDIPADTSGRSFVIKLPTSQVYFWCSEKSMLLGNELLAKMKDVFERKPSLVELSGISETKFEIFSVHFREYLLGSTASKKQSNQVRTPVTSLGAASYPSMLDTDFQISSSSSKLSLPTHDDSHTLRAYSHSFSDDTEFALTPMMGVGDISSTDNKKPSEGSTPPSSSLGFLESLGNLASLTSSSQLLQGLASSKGPAGGSYFSSPYYCSCPPCTSTIHYAEVPLTTNSFPNSFPLPPLSSLLSSNMSLSPFATLTPPTNLLDVTCLNLSGLLSDPVVQVPLSISFATVSSSQQFPTFTPLMCDPIVHIPAIGVCTSGPGFLVGAGHAGPTTSPLHPHIVNPSIADTESMLEKGARETLQLLLNSAQTNPWSRDMLLPAVVTGAVNIHEHDMFGVGRHVKCSETTGVDTVMEFGTLPLVCDIKGRHGGDTFDWSEGGCGIQEDAHSDDVNSDVV